MVSFGRLLATTYNLIFDGYWRAPKIGDLPGSSGIYTVYAGEYNEGQNTVSLRKLSYVGESENIRDRAATFGCVDLSPPASRMTTYRPRWVK